MRKQSETQEQREETVPADWQRQDKSLDSDGEKPGAKIKLYLVPPTWHVLFKDGHASARLRVEH
jgi:hypothetical protein